MSAEISTASRELTVVLLFSTTFDLRYWTLSSPKHRSARLQGVLRSTELETELSAKLEGQHNCSTVACSAYAAAKCAMKEAGWYWLNWGRMPYTLWQGESKPCFGGEMVRYNGTKAVDRQWTARS